MNQNERRAISRGVGARQAEVTVDALYSTANWLRSEGMIPLTAALCAKGWRGHLLGRD